MTLRRTKPDFCAAALFVGAAVLFPLVAGAHSERPAPAAVFSTRTDFELDDFELADVVHAEWPEVQYDAGAARAARDYAARSRSSIRGNTPPAVWRREKSSERTAALLCCSSWFSSSRGDC